MAGLILAVVALLLGARRGGCHHGEFAGAVGVGQGWGRAGGDPPQLESRQFIVVLVFRSS